MLIMRIFGIPQLVVARLEMSQGQIAVNGFDVPATLADISENE